MYCLVKIVDLIEVSLFGNNITVHNILLINSIYRNNTISSLCAKLRILLLEGNWKIFRWNNDYSNSNIAILITERCSFVGLHNFCFETGSDANTWTSIWSKLVHTAIEEWGHRKCCRTLLVNGQSADYNVSPLAMWKSMAGWTAQTFNCMIHPWQDQLSTKLINLIKLSTVYCTWNLKLDIIFWKLALIVIDINN